MTPAALMLTGLALGFIAMLAWLEDRANRRRLRRRRAIEKIYWPDSPPAQPRAPNKRERAILLYHRSLVTCCLGAKSPTRRSGLGR